MTSTGTSTSATSLSPWGDISWSRNSTSPQKVEREIEDELRVFLTSASGGEVAILSSPHLSLHSGTTQDVVRVLYQLNPEPGRVILTYLSSKHIYKSAIARALRSLLLQPDLASAYTEEWEQEQVATTVSSVQQKDVEEITEEFRRLFAAGKEEFFEDGLETNFSRNLITLVDKYGDDAITVLDNLIVGEQVNAEVASEALRWLGQMDNPLSHHQRLWLLERSLNHTSARVRDGAALGIAFLDDPSAIPYIERAIQQESVTELRQDMQQVLEQLTETSLESTP